MKKLVKDIDGDKCHWNKNIVGKRDKSCWGLGSSRERTRQLVLTSDEPSPGAGTEAGDHHP